MRGGVEINFCLMRGGYNLGHISPISTSSSLPGNYCTVPNLNFGDIVGGGAGVSGELCVPPEKSSPRPCTLLNFRETNRLMSAANSTKSTSSDTLLTFIVTVKFLLTLKNLSALSKGKVHAQNDEFYT